MTASYRRWWEGSPKLVDRKTAVRVIASLEKKVDSLKAEVDGVRTALKGWQSRCHKMEVLLAHLRRDPDLDPPTAATDREEWHIREIVRLDRELRGE